MSSRQEVKVTLRRTRPTMGIHVVTDEPSIGMKIICGADAVPVYHGQYIVTPSTTDDIVLPTKGKKLEKDITVTKIPYWETSNPQGGFTVFIGNDTTIIQ